MFNLVKVNGDYIVTDKGAFALMRVPYFDQEAIPSVSRDEMDKIRAGLLALPDLIDACREALECSPHADECRWWRANISERSTPQAIAANNALCDCHLRRLRAALAQLGPKEEA